VSALEYVPTAPGSGPQVTFSWIAPPPTVAAAGTGPLTPGTAVLEGSVNPNLWTPLSCVFDISPAAEGITGFPCAQQLSAVGSPQPVSATATGLTPGTTYTFTLTAATVAGQSTSAPRSFTTPASGTSPQSQQEAAVPTVSALRLSPTSFRRGSASARLKAGTARSHPAAHSTTIAFTLSHAATVTFNFAAAGSGVVKGKHCAAARRGTRGRRCPLDRTIPSQLTVASPAGHDAIVFDGVADRGARLATGSYRLTATASDSAGSSTAQAHPLFTIMR
jgi:hypothetical protein